MTQNVSPRQPEGGRAGGGRSPLELPHVRELLLKTRRDPELRMYKWYQEEYWEGLSPREKAKILISALVLRLGEVEPAIKTRNGKTGWAEYVEEETLAIARAISNVVGVKIFGGVKFVAVEPSFWHPYVAIVNFVNPYQEAWKFYIEPLEGQLEVGRLFMTRERPLPDSLYVDVEYYRSRVYLPILKRVCEITNSYPEVCGVLGP